MKRTTSPLLLASSLLLLVIPMHGNQEGGGTPPPPPLKQQFPGPLQDADFGAIVAGDFTGNLTVDAFVMDGDEPVLVATPEVQDTAVRTGATANDIAVLSGTVPNKDVLLVVGAGGLTNYERDSGNKTWIVTTIHGPSSDWAAASLVATGEVDGQPGMDVVGVGWDTQEVLVSHGNGDGTFTAAAGFTAFGTAYDLFLLDWDGDATDEIALLTSLGVEVYEPDGSYVDVYTWSHPILATVIDDAGTDVQRLAMVSDTGGSPQFLLCFGRNGLEGPYALGAPGVVAMASGDPEGSGGGSAIFLGITASRKVWMLPNLSPATPSYDVANIQTFPFGPPHRDASLNHAGLAVADFDGDGDNDVLAPAQGELQPPITTYGQIDLVRLDADHEDYLVGLDELDYYIDENRMEVLLHPPTTKLEVLPGQQRMLDVHVWHTPDLGHATLVTPHDHSTIDWPAADPFEVRFDLPETYDLGTSHDLFTVEVRQVVVDTASGYFVDQGPAFVAIVAPEPNWPTVRDAPETVQMLLPIPFLSIGTPGSNPVGGIGVGPTVPSGGEEEADEEEQQPVNPDPGS